MNYKITFKGDLDRITRALEDLVEKKVTGWNLDYNVKINNFNWATDPELVSVVAGDFEFDREISRRDLRMFEDTYRIRVAFND